MNEISFLTLRIGGMAKVAFDPETGKITEAVWKWDVLTYMEQLGGFEVNLWLLGT